MFLQKKIYEHVLSYKITAKHVLEQFPVILSIKPVLTVKKT